MALPTTSFNSSTISLDLLNKITSNLSFKVPDIDFSDSKYQIPEEILELLKQKIKPVTIIDVTTGEVDGEGAFDKLMTSVKKHLAEELDNNRLTGAEYAQVYTSLTQAALQNAITFTLSKDKAFLDATATQLQAINMILANEQAKVQLAIAQAQAHTNKAQYASTVSNLAIQDSNYMNAREQAEASRAQTQDNRTDGASVSGLIGKNKSVMEQQITSFKRKDEANMLKYANDWTSVAKTQDSGMVPPSIFENSSIDKLMRQGFRNVNLNA